MNIVILFMKNEIIIYLFIEIISMNKIKSIYSYSHFIWIQEYTFFYSPFPAV